MAFKRDVAKIAVTPPNMQTAKFRIVGTAPMVQNRFSARARGKLIELVGTDGKPPRPTRRPARDLDRECREATHVSDEGWYGLPATAFRNGLISACRLIGYPMTRAKLSLFTLADGYETDETGIQPLVRITKGKPVRMDYTVRPPGKTTTDMRPRPTWTPGWEAMVTLRFDADQFSLQDVTNLLARMGEQVGIGAGRHDSRDSNGMGWGTFKIARKA